VSARAEDGTRSIPQVSGARLDEELPTEDYVDGHRAVVRQLKRMVDRDGE
jgi:hypothetical protein